MVEMTTPPAAATSPHLGPAGAPSDAPSTSEKLSRLQAAVRAVVAAHPLPKDTVRNSEEVEELVWCLMSVLSDGLQPGQTLWDFLCTLQRYTRPFHVDVEEGAAGTDAAPTAEAAPLPDKGYKFAGGIIFLLQSLLQDANNGIKAVAFVRVALNETCLQSCIDLLLETPEIVHANYRDGSLFMSPTGDEYREFCRIIAPIAGPPLEVRLCGARVEPPFKFQLEPTLPTDGERALEYLRAAEATARRGAAVEVVKKRVVKKKVPTVTKERDALATKDRDTASDETGGALNDNVASTQGETASTGGGTTVKTVTRKKIITRKKTSAATTNAAEAPQAESTPESVAAELFRDVKAASPLGLFTDKQDTAALEAAAATTFPIDPTSSMERLTALIAERKGTARHELGSSPGTCIFSACVWSSTAAPATVTVANAAVEHHVDTLLDEYAAAIRARAAEAAETMRDIECEFMSLLDHDAGTESRSAPAESKRPPSQASVSAQ